MAEQGRRFARRRRQARCLLAELQLAGRPRLTLARVGAGVRLRRPDALDGDREVLVLVQRDAISSCSTGL
jgi:hypothetical protein